MKKYLIIAFIALGFSAKAQQSPTNKTRSNNDFSQVDNYLIGLKRLGIPTSDTDNLDAAGLPQNAVKLLYNTTTSSLRIYNPVLGIWSEAADLSQYYTRAQIDAAFNTKLNKSGGELNGDLKLLRRPGSPDSYKLRLGDGGSAYVAYEDRSYGQGLALVTGTNENVNVNSGGSINLLPANHINLNSIIVKDFGDNFTKGFSFGGNARFEATNVDTQLQPFDFYVSSGSASTTPGYSIFKIRREGSSPFFDIRGSDGTIIVSGKIEDAAGKKFLKEESATGYQFKANEGDYVFYDKNSVAARLGNYASNRKNTFQYPTEFIEGVSSSNINGTYVGLASGASENNIAVGTEVLVNNTTGIQNTGVGYYSMHANTTGNQNTGIGTFALPNVSTGFRNTGLGASAINYLTTGQNNIGLGYSSGLSVVTGSDNIVIGTSANTAGDNSNSIVIGNGAVGIGSNTTVIGTGETLKSKIYGALEDGNGVKYLKNGDALPLNGGNLIGPVTYNGDPLISSIPQHIVFGGNGVNTQLASPNVTLRTLEGQGDALVEVGPFGYVYRSARFKGINTFYDGSNFATGERNFATGYTGAYNTALGSAVLTALTSGNFNVAAGREALFSLTTGSENVAYGRGALGSLTTGNYNLGIGASALMDTNGSANIGIGHSAGEGANGDFNLFLGYRAGRNAIGNFNFAVGMNVQNGERGEILKGNFQSGLLQVPYTLEVGEKMDIVSPDKNSKFSMRAQNDGSAYFYNDQNGAGWAVNAAKGLYDLNNGRRYLKENEDAIIGSLNVMGNVNIGSGGSLTSINSFGLEQGKPLFLGGDSHYLSTAVNVSLGDADLKVRRGGADEPFLPVLTRKELKTLDDDVEIIDTTKGIILHSPNGTRYRVTINDAGDFVKTAL